MLGLIIATVFVEAVLLTLVIYNLISKERREVEKRVTEVVGRAPTVREQELKAPLYRRAIKPALTKVSSLVVKAVPAEKEAELGKKIVAAGINEKIAPRELLVIKYLAAAGFAALLWMLAGITTKTFVQPVLMGAGPRAGCSADIHNGRMTRKQEVKSRGRPSYCSVGPAGLTGQ